MFFLVCSGFCLGTLPWMPFLYSLFLIVESWTLTLIEASEACSSLDVVSAFFYDLLDESSLRSWRPNHSWEGSSLVPSFLHLWIMALTEVRWSPKALEISLKILSMIHVNYVVSHLFLNFFRSGMMCCSLSMPHFVREALFKWFLDSNRSSSNQAWVWLVKINSAF